MVLAFAFGQGGIVFKITQNHQSGWINPELPQAGGVLLRLHGQGLEGIKKRPEEPTKPAVSDQRTFRDPAIDQKAGDIAPIQLPQEIRPKIGLHQDKEIGPCPGNQPLYAPKQIKGKGEETVDLL